MSGDYGPGPCPPALRCPDRTLCPLACIEAGSREDPSHRPTQPTPAAPADTPGTEAGE